MKEKRKLETTRKAKRMAIFMAIYADVLFLVPILLSLIFGLDEAKTTYIIAITVATIIIFVMAYKMVMFLHKYHQDNPPDEP